MAELLYRSSESSRGAVCLGSAYARFAEGFYAAEPRANGSGDIECANAFKQEGRRRICRKLEARCLCHDGGLGYCFD